MTTALLTIGVPARARRRALHLDPRVPPLRCRLKRVTNVRKTSVTAAPVSSDAVANSLPDCLKGGRRRGRSPFRTESSKTQHKGAKGAREERHGYRDGGSPMAQNDANAPTNFDAPAPVCVCGLLVVAALTKVGHPHWGIVGMISAYVCYLALQYAKHGAGSAWRSA